MESGEAPPISRSSPESVDLDDALPTEEWQQVVQLIREMRAMEPGAREAKFEEGKVGMNEKQKRVFESQYQTVFMHGEYTDEPKGAGEPAPQDAALEPVVEAGRVKGLPFGVNGAGNAVLTTPEGKVVQISHGGYDKKLFKSDWPRWHAERRAFLDKADFESAENTSMHAGPGVVETPPRAEVAPGPAETPRPAAGETKTVEALTKERDALKKHVDELEDLKARYEALKAKVDGGASPSPLSDRERRRSDLYARLAGVADPKTTKAIEAAETAFPLFPHPKDDAEKSQNERHEKLLKMLEERSFKIFQRGAQVTDEATIRAVAEHLLKRKEGMPTADRVNIGALWASAERGGLYGMLGSLALLGSLSFPASLPIMAASAAGGAAAQYVEQWYQRKDRRGEGRGFMVKNRRIIESVVALSTTALGLSVSSAGEKVLSILAGHIGSGAVGLKGLLSKLAAGKIFSIKATLPNSIPL